MVDRCAFRCRVFAELFVTEFVVTGFGVFFVFAVKQAPDRKMRSFKKSIPKPAVRTSFMSSLKPRSSIQEVCTGLVPSFSRETIFVMLVALFAVRTGHTSSPGAWHVCSIVLLHFPMFIQAELPALEDNPLPPGWISRNDGYGKPCEC